MLMKTIESFIHSICEIPLRALICGILCTSSVVIHADWDPQVALKDEDPFSLDRLQVQAFQDLKVMVAQSLVNSWCTPEKVNLLMDVVLVTRPKVCVEIGAFSGSSVLPIAATLKYLQHGKIYAIDAWSNPEAIKYLDNDDPNKHWWANVNMNVAYDKFRGMINKWELTPYCFPIRNPSNKAVNQIGSIDFLHLDGDYSEKGALEDVQLFIPKVKTDGYILLSNLFTTVKGKQPKIKSFCKLLESCEIVAEIEQDNAILFRKYPK